MLILSKKIFRSIDYLEKDLKGYMLDIIDDIYIDENYIFKVDDGYKFIYLPDYGWT